MENVSKFLLMAATILLSVLIISMFVYIFNSGSSASETYDRKQQIEQLELYNSKFEVYARDNNTIVDIISLLNLAYNVNETSNYDSQDSVRVIVDCNGKKIEIPSTETESQNINKNQVLIGGEVKENYDLLSKELKDLKINGFTDSDTLSLTKLIKDDYDKTKTKTIYKYLFRNDTILYEHSNGKVSKIEFTMYKNPEF